MQFEREKMLKKCSYTIDNFTFTYSVDIQPPQGLDIKHCHDTYEILYVLGGSGRFMIEGTSFDIKPGTLLVIRPFEYHSMQLDGTSDYERYVIHFPESYLINDASDLFKAILDGVEGSGKVYSAGSLSKNILPILERFDIAEALPDNEKSIYVKTLLSELMVFLSVSGGEQIAINEGELGAPSIHQCLKCFEFQGRCSHHIPNHPTVLERFLKLKRFCCGPVFQDLEDIRLKIFPQKESPAYPLQ